MVMKSQKLIPLPSIEELREALDYNPATGVLTWKKPGNPANAHLIGQRAGTARKKTGRRAVTVKSKMLLSSRVGWAIHYGRWPEGLVDHENLDPSDDRIDNLRDASNSQNSMNVPCSAGSGIKGAYRAGKRWASRIMIDGVDHYLGVFQTPELAGAAYAEASGRLHGEFGRAK